MTRLTVDQFTRLSELVEDPSGPWMWVLNSERFHVTRSTLFALSESGAAELIDIRAKEIQEEPYVEGWFVQIDRRLLLSVLKSEWVEGGSAFGLWREFPKVDYVLWMGTVVSEQDDRFLVDFKNKSAKDSGRGTFTWIDGGKWGRKRWALKVPASVYREGGEILVESKDDLPEWKVMGRVIEENRVWVKCDIHRLPDESYRNADIHERLTLRADNHAKGNARVSEVTGTLLEIREQLRADAEKNGWDLGGWLVWCGGEEARTQWEQEYGQPFPACDLTGDTLLNFAAVAWGVDQHHLQLERCEPVMPLGKGYHKWITKLN